MDDKDTGLPSMVTSATSILSRAMPVIVPRFPFVLLDMISSNGTLVSESILCFSCFCFCSSAANLRSSSIRFCLSASNSADDVIGLV